MRLNLLSWFATCAAAFLFVGVALPPGAVARPARHAPSLAVTKTIATSIHSASQVQSPAMRVVALTVDPPEITLTSSAARQRLLVTAEYPDGSKADVTGLAHLVLSPATRVALTAPATLVPLSDGDAQIVAGFGGRQAFAAIKITGSHRTIPVSFTNDVVPVLTKIGCNGGACHGATVGRGGFKLSLRGFDPVFDWDQIVKADDGAHVDVNHPEQSLVFRKPAGETPHGGGLRLPEGSVERATLKRWLVEGMAAPDDKVSITDLVVTPAARMLAHPGMTQQILATAVYSDGSTRDVTNLARYSSNDDSVAAVTDTGGVTAKSGGEAAIMVSYGGKVQAPRILVPIGKTPVLHSELPASNFIDDDVYEKLSLLRIHPSALCTDQEFFRRASLDITGTLPTREDVEAFVRDHNPNKRAEAVDRFLSQPEYVDFRTLQLADMLRVNSTYLKPEGAEAYYRWLHEQVAANTPWDKLVHQIIASQGHTFWNGPANYYRVVTDPSELAETTSETFLGVRMQCARCHNHPFEKWTQNDYYSFAAYFARVGHKEGTEYGDDQIFVRSAGEVTHPKTKLAMAPKPLGGDTALPLPEGGDRRIGLADWLTSPTNTMFAREAVNRTWANFFGKGITDPVDDVRVSNPPSNEKLLDDLAKAFVQHGYDVKWLIRLITTSRTYSLSSEPTPTNMTDTRHFARALPRRLTAEQALDAVNTVTGKSDRFGTMPAGTRAIQLTDSHMGNYFLSVFGKPKREVLCTCERDMQPNLSQSLHMINGGDIQGKLAAQDGWLHQKIKAGATDTDIIVDLYLRAVSRYPTPDEIHLALSVLQSDAGSGQPSAGTKPPGSGSADPGNAGTMAGGTMSGGAMTGDSMSDAPAGGGSTDAGTMAGGTMTSMDGGGDTMSGAPASPGASGKPKPTHGKVSGLMVGGPRPGVTKGGGSPSPVSNLSPTPQLDPRERTSDLEDIAWAVLNSREFLFNH